MTYRTDVPTDTALELLAHRDRRRLLLAIQHGDGDRTQIESIRRETENAKRLAVAMRHVHLPKLEAAGIVEWNRETNEVRKGERFEGILPFVRSIVEAPEELTSESR